MLLGGLWHGASWNFIIWGALHGTGLAIHKIWSLGPGKLLSTQRNKWIDAVAIVITFHFVCVGWIFFKAHSFDNAGHMLYQIFYNMDVSIWKPFVMNYKVVLGMMLFAFSTHALADNLMEKKLDKIKSIPFIVYLLIYLGFVLLYGVFKSADPVLPIYLQF
jgi:D-alanyl-lipoteichoic acid acyltransferase DltB (MBOAT superfamily)